MKKIKREIVSAMGLMVVAMNASAFNDGDIIGFDPGECDPATSVACAYGYPVVTKGSYFALDLDGNGSISTWERTAISPGPDGGIIVGSPQPGPGIDTPWMFFGIEGRHQTSTAITQNADGTLDFSGWEVYWNGMVVPFPDGNATVTCSHALPCTVNDQYHIDFTSFIESGPFRGIMYTVHLENTVKLPEIRVAIDIAAGNIQECASTGGNAASMSANVTLLNGAQLAGLEWTVDGQPAGTTASISPFLSLGAHTVSVTATSVSGMTKTATEVVNIFDTVAPSVSATFVDTRSGDVVTSIDTRNTAYVGVNITSSDVCDAAPSNSAVGGFELKDGDTLKIQGNLDKVELTTSTVTVQAEAADQSGNVAKTQAVLSITQ